MHKVIEHNEDVSRLDQHFQVDCACVESERCQARFYFGRGCAIGFGRSRWMLTARSRPWFPVVGFSYCAFPCCRFRGVILQLPRFRRQRLPAFQIKHKETTSRLGGGVLLGHADCPTCSKPSSASGRLWTAFLLGPRVKSQTPKRPRSRLARPNRLSSSQLCSPLHHYPCRGSHRVYVSSLASAA
jgi:hypothetical protein